MLLPRSWGAPGAVEILVEVEELGVAASLLPGLIKDFVAVGKTVHQFRVQGFLAEVGSFVDDTLKLIGRDLPGGADAFFELAKPGG